MQGLRRGLDLRAIGRFQTLVINPTGVDLQQILTAQNERRELRRRCDRRARAKGAKQRAEEFQIVRLVQRPAQGLQAAAGAEQEFPDEGDAIDLELDALAIAAERDDYREALQRVKAEFDNYKKRVARPGGGKSGGYRTLLSARFGSRYVFLYGFPKSDKANITQDEKKALQFAGKVFLELSAEALSKALQSGVLLEVHCEQDH